MLPTHMGGEEMRFVREAFASNYIAPIGPMVDAFEQEFAEYVGIKHCLALSSGTAAMPWLNTLRCPAEFNGVNILRSGFLEWGRPQWNGPQYDFLNLRGKLRCHLR